MARCAWGWSASVTGDPTWPATWLRAPEPRAGCASCGCSRRSSTRSRRARVLRPSERAPGLLVGDDVELPDDVELGGNVVIHAGTLVGAGARIQDGAVLGKPVALGPLSAAPRGPAPGLEVGEGA